MPSKPPDIFPQEQRLLAELDVPPARLIKLGNNFHTFCAQRFDRAHGARRFYASAMALLRKTQSEGTRYLELAQFIRAQGEAEHVLNIDDVDHRPSLQSCWLRQPSTGSVTYKPDGLRMRPSQRLMAGKKRPAVRTLPARPSR